jgi:uncharacterized protein
MRKVILFVCLTLLVGCSKQQVQPGWSPVFETPIGRLNQDDYSRWQTNSAVTDPLQLFYIGNSYYDKGEFHGALYFFRKASDGGITSASYNAGLILESGKGGVSRNETEAIRFFRKAAEAGMSDAQYALGSMIYNGRGADKDPWQALYWYKKAASQGNAYAMNNIGRLYGLGEGVPQNDVEALYWCGKSAELGNRTAQSNLGRNLMRLSKNSSDKINGYMWLILGAMGGEADAMSNRDLARSSLDAQQISQAQYMAQKWLDSHPFANRSK